MSRRVEAGATVLAVTALVLTVLIVGRVSAHSGQAPAVLTGPAAGSTTHPPATSANLLCDVGAGAGGLQLRGVCAGALTEPFACVAAVDDLYLTGRHQLDTAHVLYLTLNIESYRQHAGDYAGAQAVLQVTGPATVERWSNYAVGVHVADDRSVTMPPTVLAADAGTGSSGTVTASGAIRCATA
ncbi:MAG TPA: hypothetical protein VFA84_13280 [Acidimicrobiales bacterium]|nr:hypothetical protein [Acidimicrobiales bacterium]